MAAGSMVHCQLWMGGLEPYMTESFILASFERMGEKPLNVKVMRNKFTGEPAGYCFVHFENDDEAIDAMHKLNGKVIPNTNPPVRFRLNTATNQGKIMMGDREFSLWVGDLSPEVDDYTLYKTFAAKYQSLRAAKVILDHSGYSKGFGFLRFGSEEEQKHCLNHMNGYKNLGSKPIKISNAIPKTQRNSSSNGQQQTQQSGGYQYPQDYSHYYDPNSYWQNYSQWGGYGYDPNTGYGYDPSSYAAAQQYGSGQYQTQYSQYPPSSATGYPPQQGSYGSYSGGPYSSYYPPPQGGTSAPPPSSMASHSGPPPAHSSAISSGAVVDEANEIVEHSRKIDVEKENKEYAESILNHLEEMASTTMVDRQLFQDEMYKLNIIDVTIPRMPAKLINQIEARRAVEAHEPFVQLDPNLTGPLEASSPLREESEEPAEKKRKLSTHEEESAKEGEAAEVEPAKGAESEERPQETVVEVEPEDEETREKKAKLKEEWAKAKRFMAEVDVLPMMTETESVSSESTRISDDDIESLNGDSKIGSQVKETPIADSTGAIEADGAKNEVKGVENADLDGNVVHPENERLGDSKYDPDEDSMDADEDTPIQSADQNTQMESTTQDTPVEWTDQNAQMELTAHDVPVESTDHRAPKEPTATRTVSPQQSSHNIEAPTFRRVTRSGARKLSTLVVEEVKCIDETSQMSETAKEFDAEPIVDEDSLDDQPLIARLGSCDPNRSPTEEVIIEECTDSRISGSGSVQEFQTTVISSDDSRSGGSVDGSTLIADLVNGEDNANSLHEEDADSLHEDRRDDVSQDSSYSSED